MIVGTAEIEVLPLEGGFAPALRHETDTAFAGVSHDAEKAGQEVGTSLEKGTKGGLGNLAGLLSAVGVPIGGFQHKVEGTGKALEDAGKSGSGLVSAIGDIPSPVAIGGAALLAAGGYAIHLAAGMQKAEAAIKGATDQAPGEIKKIGAAFLDTAGKSTFSGQEMAEAFAPVSAQLEQTQGHALKAGEALEFMTSAGDLAEAKQISLTEATSALSSVMQAFGLKTTESAHTADVLYAASNATGVSVGSFAQQIARMRSRLGPTSGSVGELSATIVDLTHAGITGRGAMSALNSGMNFLLKSNTTLTNDLGKQHAAFDALPSSIKKVVTEYDKGSITSKDYKKALEGLTPAQANQVKEFTTAQGAAQKAQAAYSQLGVTVFNSQGNFVGMGSVISQLAPKFAHMTQAQKLAAATTIFGSGAARQMVSIIDAGPAAYDKATKAVERHGSAQKAASAQSKTLEGEEKTLGATFSDVGTKLGLTLIPVVTKLGEILVKLAPIVSFVVELMRKDFELNIHVMEAVVHVWVSVFKTIEKVTVGAAKAVAGAVSGAWHTVESLTSGLAHSVAGFFSGLWHTVTGGVSSGVHTVTHFFSELPGKILNVLKALPGEMLHMGEEVVEGLLHGLEKAGAGLIHKAEDLANKVESPFKKVLGLLSPSKVFQKHGENIVAGLVMGMKKGEPMAAAASLSVAQQIMQFWESKGYSHAAAAGFVGNAAQESSLSPGAPGGGLYQQSGYPASYGEGSVAQQSQHVLENLPSSLRAALKDITDPARAANLIMKYYERPKGSQPGEEAYVGIANPAHREAAARQAFAEGGGRGGGGSGASARIQAQHSKESLAQEKAKLAKEQAQQKAALASWAAEQTYNARSASAEEKARVKQEIAAKKAALAAEQAAAKAALSQQTAAQKAEQKKQTSDAKAGTSWLDKMLEQIHSGSLKSIEKLLYQAHIKGLDKIEKSLSHDHSAALAKLSSELVKVHKEAMAKEVSLQKKANEEKAQKEAEQRQAAAEKASEEATKAAEKAAEEQRQAAEAAEQALINSINKSASIASDQAQMQVDQITDATKVTLDKQAEVGLSGTQEITAHLQTIADEVQQEMDKRIDQAKIEQDESAGKGAVAEAEAAAKLGQIENEAKIREAEAQSKLELSKKEGGEGGEGGSAPGQSGGSFNITINGANASAAEIFRELGWNMKTGLFPEVGGITPGVVT